MLRFTEEELSERMHLSGATINETTSADKAHRPAVIVLKHAEKVTQPAPAQTNVNKVAYRRERAGKPRRKNDEHDFQVRLIACCRAIGATGAAHDLGLDVLLTLLHAIPNGGKRDKITAAKMMQEGQLSGIPDLSLPVACRGYHGMYLEMKAGKNTTSQNQKTKLAQLAAGGYYTVICYSPTAALHHILWYLGSRLTTECQSIVARHGMVIDLDDEGRVFHPNGRKV